MLVSLRRATWLAAACLLVASQAALAGPGRRVDDAQYNYTDGIAYPGGTSGRVVLGFAEFETLPRERSVSLTITDTLGGDVAGRAAQDLDGDGEFDVEQDFCGATDSPLPITGGVELTVFVMEGTCGDTPAVPTSGSIRAIFRAK